MPFCVPFPDIRLALRSSDDHVLSVANRLSSQYGGGRAIAFFKRLGSLRELAECDWVEDRIYWKSDAYVTSGGEDIAPNTYEEDAFTCTCCDAINHFRESRPYGDEGGMICESCRGSGYYSRDSRGSWWRLENNPENEPEDDNEDGSCPIRSYNTDVLSIFSKRKAFRRAPGEADRGLKTRWLGVELEVLHKYDDSRAPRDTLDAVSDFAILKRDGSLAEYGFEIVTVPATLRMHRLMWMPFFDGPAKRLRSWKTDCCGMHVHVSRASMSDLTFGRAQCFINNEPSRKFIEHVAGRGHGDYCHVYKKEITSHRGDTHTDRYEALAKRGRTVELRIFRGNVSVSGFFKNLDFADAVFAFCEQASNVGLDTGNFLRWLNQPENRKTYRFLTAWAIKVGYLKQFKGQPKIEQLEAA